MASDFYQQLGVRPLINAAGHYTVYGGSRPTPAVRAAMDAAAGSMVDIIQLQQAAHAEIARLTRNEAAYVTPGTAAGLYLAVVAAVSLRHNVRVEDLEPQVIRQGRVLAPLNGRNPYDIAVRQVGVELTYVADIPEALTGPLARDAVAVLLPLIGQPDGISSAQECCRAARNAGLPLIIDAAAQIPPVRNLWELPSTGADAVLFSGGKALGAPQSTGLILGQAAFIDVIDKAGFPRHGYGRMFKVGRDQIIGMLAALHEVLSRDEVAWLAEREKIAARLRGAFSGHALLEVTRGFPNLAGQPVPYALFRRMSAEVDIPRIVDTLRDSDPCVVVGQIPGEKDYTDGFIVNTLALSETEAELVLSAILAAVDGPVHRNAKEVQ